MSSKSIVNSYKKRKRRGITKQSKKIKTEDTDPNATILSNPTLLPPSTQGVDKNQIDDGEETETDDESNHPSAIKQDKEEKENSTASSQIQRQSSIAMVYNNNSGWQQKNIPSLIQTASASQQTQQTQPKTIIKPWTAQEQAEFFRENQGKTVTAYRFVSSDLKSHGGFQYEVGKMYTLKENETPRLCQVGFHAHPTALQALQHAIEDFGPHHVASLRLMKVSGSGPFVVGPTKIAFTTVEMEEIKDANQQMQLLSGSVENHNDGWIHHYKMAKLHSENDEPAIYNPKTQSKQWFYHGMRHRDGDKPCLISQDGSYQEYRIMNQLHRDDPSKPAIIAPDKHYYYTLDRLIRIVPVASLSSSSSSSSSFISS
jgi:hypothetical protein